MFGPYSEFSIFNTTKKSPKDGPKATPPKKKQQHKTTTPPE